MIVTFSGPSGVGKSSVAGVLIERFGCHLVLSSTTRAPKPTDLTGEYEYLTRADFRKYEARGEFLWTMTFAGRRYGTKQAFLQAALNPDPRIWRVMILIPEVITNLRKFATKLGLLGSIRHAFLLPESANQLAIHLAKRDADENEIAKRLAASAHEERLARASEIPYEFIVNQEDRLEDTAKAVWDRIHRSSTLPVT